MQQIVRTLTMVDASVAGARRMLICDRDRKWSRDVRRLLEEVGIHVVMTPARAPNANAYAERFVRSMKEECLNRMIPIGEQHFRRAIAEYVEHYHQERNHQGLDNRLIAGVPTTDVAGRVHRRSRLGGLLNYYQRAA
jgi:transposase InsO family protein